MAKKTGARYLAETLQQSGVTHVFFVPAILLNALAEMETLGIRRIMWPVRWMARLPPFLPRIARKTGWS
jgi:hypothetical protein